MNNQDIATALSRVHEAAKKHGGHIVHTSEIERRDRELLTRNHWLQEILRGWYMLTRPDVQSGDTSAWYANFWDFVGIYLNEVYGNEYCLSAENSIDLQIGCPTIPKQVIVLVKKGGGKLVKLPYDTSILPYSDESNFPQEQTIIRGLRAMTLPYALCKVTPTYFQKNAKDAQIALGLVKNPQDFIYIIAAYGFVRPGERLIGAYEQFAPEKAKLIQEGLKQIGIYLKSINPFERQLIAISPSSHSPYALRIIHLWEQYRQIVLDHFPKVSKHKQNTVQTLHELEELYVRDAYHSLSIEGYHVNQELIEKVQNHRWNPDQNFADGQQRNALAARGYYEAFLEVKKGILRILNGEAPGAVIELELQNWFQKLFSPNVQAGILKHSELLGYRRNQVYIRNSRHVPFPKEALFEAMEAFFNCMKKEPEAPVRAILGHFFFVYIHPFMDGNGRLGRFIMNGMLVSAGFPWTIVNVKNRSFYFNALETASVNQDIKPFTQFIAQEMQIS